MSAPSAPLADVPNWGADNLPIRLALVCLCVPFFGLALNYENILWADSVSNHNLTPALRVGSAVFAALYSGIALSLLLIAIRTKLPVWLNRYVFVVVSLAIGFAYTATLLIPAQPYGTDGAAVPPYAAQVLLHGGNPYTDAPVSAALAAFHMPATTATRLTDGTPWEAYPYPAGSFLSLAPMVAAGLTDVRSLYIGALLVTYGLLFFAASEQHKPLVATVLMLHHQLHFPFVAAGLQEPLWALPVVLSWLLRRHTTTASLLLGYAASVKQLGVLFIPFYVAYQYKTRGAGGAGRAAALSIGVFAVTNLPFLLLAPSAWVSGVLSLTLVPLPAMGMGPAMLSGELLPALPNALYTVISLAALGGGVLWYLRTPGASDRYVWILPLLSLWFAWRSPINYFYLVPLLAVITLVSKELAQDPGRPGGATTGGNLPARAVAP